MVSLGKLTLAIALEEGSLPKHPVQALLSDLNFWEEDLCPQGKRAHLSQLSLHSYVALCVYTLTSAETCIYKIKCPFM